MARIVEAVRDYGPKVDLNPTAQLEQVADWMAMRTGLNKSEVMMVLQESNEAILYFNSQGTPVKLPGVGTFTPSVDREGTFKINFRADADLKKGINAGDAYKGRVTNKNRIGLDNAGYKALWDADHAGDPLEV
jgi:nucleoid DNA-binding protein